MEISSLPWNRAIETAHSGDQAHGLLTAVRSEAPSFLFSNNPIMSYQVCFYGPEETEWRYRNSADLSSFPGKLGFIASYGYGKPLDEFLSSPSNKSKILEVRGLTALNRLMKMLSADRIQLLVADRNIISWLKVSKPHPEVLALREKGCLTERPFYIAFNSTLPWASEIISILDRELAAPENQKIRAEISEAYLGPALN
ncbi:hypothetical protein [Sneathiella limimaris]|uniref:hypothetical protein n=1 Tax=Sneathiella limimaris TaxID=1964213 RepID=UPI001F10BE69|nr:hypothetical protein [Sneathiella limimaris]